MLKRESKIRITSGGPQPLVSYLSQRFTYHTSETWLAEMMAGRVLVNHQPCEGGCLVASGDEIEYRPEPRPEPEVDRNVQLLYDDGALVVLAKSGNLPCHPAGCFFNNTLWGMLKSGEIAGLEPMDDIHFVSRLDRETSGIVLVAKTARAAKMATKALASPGSSKEYRVLVEGLFPDAMEATGWLEADTDSCIQKKRRFVPSADDSQPVSQGAEWAHTSFACLRQFDGMSLLSAVLHTGRTHQIRTTLCSLGFPVVGDKLYGVDETMFLRFIEGKLTDSDCQRLRMARQALHAYRLVVPTLGLDVVASVEWNAKM